MPSSARPDAPASTVSASPAPTVSAFPAPSGSAESSASTSASISASTSASISASGSTFISGSISAAAVPVAVPDAVPMAPVPSDLRTSRSEEAVGQIPWGRIVLFFAVALAVSTALSVPFALGLLPQEVVGVIVPLAQLSPLFAAVLVRGRAADGTRIRVRDALAMPVPSRAALAHGLLAAVVVFALVPLLRMIIAVATGAAPFAPADGLLMVAVAVPAVLVMQTLFAVGEETGWRGWLHTALSPLGFWPSSLLIGALWTLWHAPIVIALGFSAREAAAYLLLILAVAPLLGALRELGRSLWPAVLGHGLLNSLRVAIDQNLLGPISERGTAGFWAVEITGWVLWLLAAAIVLRLSRVPRP